MKSTSLKKLLSALVCAALVVSLFSAAALADGETAVQTGEPVFSDLSETDALYPYVRYLSQLGILDGRPGDTFDPEAALTRAELAKIAVLAKGLPLVSGGKPAFSEVSAGHWAFSYIETAAEAGLMDGYPGGAFKPDEPVTRAEAATLLLRLSGGALSDKTLSIADVSADNWAYKQTVTAIEAGMMGESSDGLFYPDAAFTRGELAQCLTVLISLGPALREAELTGDLTVTAGEATLTGTDGSTLTLAKDQEATVTAGMTIATGNQGRANLSFDDGSGLLLEPNTTISVVRASGLNYMRPDGTPGVAVDKLEIKMSGGKLLGALANRSEGAKVDFTASAADLAWWLYPSSARERITVEDPSGVTGVWGTFWGNLVTNGGGSATSVLEGNATVSSGGQTVPLGGGQGTSVPPVMPTPPTGTPPTPQPPTPPAPMTPGQIQQFLSEQDWIRQTAQQIQNNAPTPPPAPQPPQQPGGGGQPPVTPPQTPPTPPQQPTNVMDAIQGALDRISPPPVNPGPVYTVPIINGADEINLLTGYEEDYMNNDYVCEGDPSPTTFGINWGSGPDLSQLISFSAEGLSISAGLDPGVYRITLQATNIAGTGTKPVIVTIGGLLTEVRSGIPYSVTLERPDGWDSCSFTLTHGELPLGLTLSAGGIISGTFTGDTGEYAFIVTVTETDNSAVERAYMIQTSPDAA